MDIKIFREILKKNLQEKKITLNALALESDLSEDTLRSVVYGKSQDVKLSTVIKIADVLDCPLDDLIGRKYYSDVEREIHHRIHSFPEQTLRATLHFSKMQEDLVLKQSNSGKVLLPVFVPHGNMKEGMYCDNHDVITLDISEYPKSIQEEADFGIKILTDVFEPVYYLNDILLCSCERQPEYNDIVLYFDLNGRLYLRKYHETHLESLNGFGERIPASRFSEFIPKGVVLRAVAQFDIEQFR